VYCVRGHEVSQNAAAALRARPSTRVTSKAARALARRRATRRGRSAPTQWVTRARPKIDRIACPWLIRRFIDRVGGVPLRAERRVRAFAAANGAVAYDIPDVDYTHVGPECSFDAFIRRHELAHPALDRWRPSSARPTRRR
jgi:hypothetical protein